MQILSRIIGLFPGTSRAIQGRRPAPRRRSPVVIETLENRNLMSLAGVSVVYGNLQIQAPKPSGNTTVVSIDPANHGVKVTLNGQSEEFAAGSIYNITYNSGSGGGDTFTDNTNLTTLGHLYGNANVVTGGTGYNYFYMFGSGDTYNAQAGSLSDIFEEGGPVTINNPLQGTIVTYIY